MGELLITFVIIVILYIVTTIVDIDNKIIQCIVDLIPVAIPTVYMFIHNPKTFLKFIYFTKSNITYKYDINILRCDLSIEKFEKIIEDFINEYNKNSTLNKVLTKSIGEEFYCSELKISSSIMSIKYDCYKQNIYIEFEGELSYKNFIYRIKVINNILEDTFKQLTYKNQLYKITIVYKGEGNCCNPFVARLFDSFEDKNVKISYKSKSKSDVCITNNKIEFTADSILALSESLQKELKPFSKVFRL